MILQLQQTQKKPYFKPLLSKKLLVLRYWLYVFWKTKNIVERINWISLSLIIALLSGCFTQQQEIKKLIAFMKELLRLVYSNHFQFTIGTSTKFSHWNSRSFGSIIKEIFHLKTETVSYLESNIWFSVLDMTLGDLKFKIRQ